jgi:YD repeat-containing protein
VLALKAIYAGTAGDVTIAAIPTDSRSTSSTTVTPSFSIAITGTAAQSGTITALQGGSGGPAAYFYTLAYQPTGSIKQANDTVNGALLNGNWAFGYDTLNRLTASVATSGGLSVAGTTYTTHCWAYDSFGNRTYERLAGGSSCPSLSSANATSSNSYNDATNRVSAFNGNAVTTDAAGNVIQDAQNNYVYDAEGRLCAVLNAATTATQYLYDAEGRRVAAGTLSQWPAKGQTCAAPTSANGFTLRSQYLRGLDGEAATELDGTGNWVHTNLSVSGSLAATYWSEPAMCTGAVIGPGPSSCPPLVSLSYHLSDWLGTRRVQIGSDGTLEGWWTSDPFGNYSTQGGNGADATEHHFTGKERDTESVNDYFGASVVSQADRLLFRAALARVTFSRMSVALAVQMKGLGF